MSRPNASCVVLVPSLSPATAKCEDGIKKLIKRGYIVRRMRGFSAIDQGRNQVTSDALHDGFQELMWIDSDIGFEADAIERLRQHNLPIVGGLYPQPGSRSLACELLPETEEVVFGEEGGLLEVKYVAAGFLHVRREVFEVIRDRLKLPHCNTRFSERGIWPFFQPETVEDPITISFENTEITVRHRYLTDDFAFCWRVREAGFSIHVDTSIRLWRTGPYGYGWEEAGQDVERFDSYRFQVEE